MTDLFARVKEIPTSDVIRVFLATLELKRDSSGREKARCPLHDEQTASFTVYTHGFKCYGCDASGSNIDLLIKARLADSSLEAAKMIAEKFDIPINSRKPRSQKPLTLAEYAAFLNIPQDYLADTFRLQETPNGISIPHQDENMNQVSVQMRHRLEKRKGKDNRFSWGQGKPFLYGAWAIPEWKEKGVDGVILCEGASDVQVCWFSGIQALGVPGASNFKKEWANLIFDFPKIAIIQEPGKAGEQFVNRIAVALKEKNYQGQVKAITLPEKDPRDLWLKQGEKLKQELETAISSAPQIDLESVQDKGNKKDDGIPPELERRIIHPALHIEQGFSSVGVITREGNKGVFSIVTSSGGVYVAEHIKDVLTTKPIAHPGPSGRWKRSGKVQTLSDSVALLIQKMRELVWFEDKRWYPAVSLWSAGTYLFLAFPAYPYLQLTGEKGSGKSKVQDILECVAFNAIQVVDITPAVLP